MIGIKGFAVQTALDSLKSVLPNLPDSQRVFVMCDIAFSYRLQNTDSALQYSSQARQLAQSIQHPAAIAQALNDQGIIFTDLNRYNEALDNYSQALDIRRQLHDSVGMGALHSKIGVIHQKRGAFALAIEHQLAALRIFEALNIGPYIATCQNNVGILHYNMGAPERALEMHQKALITRQKNGDDYGVASSFANIGNVLLFLKDTAGAIEKYEEAIAVFEKLNDPEGLSTNLHNLSSCYLSDQPEKALQLLTRALSLREKMGDEKMMSSTHSSLGLAHFNLGNTELAHHHYQKALKLAQRVDVLTEQLNVYELLARLHRDEGRADSTYFYFSLYHTLKDSAFNEGLREDFAELQTLYETQQKEARIALLSEQNKVIDLQVKQKQNQLWLMAFAFVAFVLVAGTAYLSYRARQKARLSAEILKERETGMKAVIAATENERERIARDLHDGVGQQLSGLKMGWQKLITELPPENRKLVEPATKLTNVLDEACNEVRHISHRMMPRSLGQYGLIPAVADMLDKSLKPAGINCQFEHFGLGNTRFPADTELCIYRVIQELVNNILKHSGASNVVVQLFKNSGHLMAIVEDNGQGLKRGISPSDGIGMRNMNSRLSTVGGNIRFENDNGLRATIKIKLQD